MSFLYQSLEKHCLIHRRQFNHVYWIHVKFISFRIEYYCLLFLSLIFHGMFPAVIFFFVILYPIDIHCAVGVLDIETSPSGNVLCLGHWGCHDRAALGSKSEGVAALRNQIFMNFWLVWGGCKYGNGVEKQQAGSFWWSALRGWCGLLLVFLGFFGWFVMLWFNHSR